VKQIQTIRTPSGPLALVRQTAEKLLAEGVISGTMDGDLHAADAATVKAAILASAICDFCSAPGAVHFFDVPDFGITKNADATNYSASKSTGGWMACDDCDALIRADKRKQLLDRAVSNHAFPKFSRRMIEELYGKFWQGMDERAAGAGAAAAIADYVEGQLTEVAQQPRTARDERIAAICRATGLSPQEMITVLEQRVALLARQSGEINQKIATVGHEIYAKLARFGRQIDKLDLGATIDKLLAEPRKPLADIVPHWQRALDAKFEAARTIRAIVAGARALIQTDATDLNDPRALRDLVTRTSHVREMQALGFADDVRALMAAQAYSFNSETASAIREAARSVPHDAPLSSIETPNVGAGWFWFAEPLELAGAPMVSDKTDALLWTWTGSGTDASIRFSAFVVARKGTAADDLLGKVLPSTKWHWPLNMTFHDMLAYSRECHRRDYGEGGKLLRDGMRIAPEEETMRVVGELSLFFVMACLWFRQTVPVLTRAPGQVERHARKRMMREHKLAEPPTVQVVALRKSLRVPAGAAEGDRVAGAREYRCRWIVRGHPRLQACGPGRKDRKLIWVEAHVAGPPEQPLKTRQRVYAVVR